MMRRRLASSAALALCLLVQAPASAKEGDPPVLLSADQMVYDDDLGIVTATGHVEMAQGGRILMANTVNYSEKTNIATASGDVVLLESGGEVIFGDYVELSDDLRQGFIDNARVLLSDNSRLAGREGERIEGRYTRLSRAVYSPCDLCKDKPEAPPIWQLRARRVTHDVDKHDIHYYNAFLDLGGIPVAYLPYFSHPDPTVDRRSGFLFPGGGTSSDLGTYARIYYFFDISPDKDFTLEVTPSQKDQLLLGGQWRQRFEAGTLDIAAAGTYAKRVDVNGTVVTHPRDFRGYVFGTGRFDLSPAWRWGFDVRRTTDDTFLRRYNYTLDDLLTSRAYIEQFKARDYLSFNAYAFQDLRPGHTEIEPEVAPLVTYSAFGEPGETLGGRWSVDASLLSLWRNHSTDTRRLSLQTGWERRFISDFGLVSTVAARARADGYWTSDLLRPGDARPIDTKRGRGFAQSQLTVSYPFARATSSMQQLIEPQVAFTASPNAPNSSLIPNEDSQNVEFDYSNLFAMSRFPGLDRLEGGQRVTYGLKAGLYGYGGGNASAFLGQSYRLQRDNDFPTGSGLENRRSDLVGNVNLSPGPWVDLRYGFRLDDRTLAPRRHDAMASLGPSIFRVSADYIFISRLAIPNSTTAASRQEITMGASSAFAKYWSISASHRRDLAQNGGPIASNVTLTYQD
jgi:LPS-assembly protein